MRARVCVCLYTRLCYLCKESNVTFNNALFLRERFLMGRPFSLLLRLVLKFAQYDTLNYTTPLKDYCRVSYLGNLRTGLKEKPLFCLEKRTSPPTPLLLFFFCGVVVFIETERERERERERSKTRPTSDWPPLALVFWW